MDWASGYVADVPYTSGYYPDTAPAHQALAALIAGYGAPEVDRPFRYLELGCGTGFGLATLAAANPHAEFLGVDFMPAHVAAGRRLASAAGLSNLRIIEASFETLAQAWPFGEFEFAVMHGVYTWVSPQVQGSLVRLLDQALAPGGLLYVGYNNMAGFAGALAAQKHLIETAARASGGSVQRMHTALRSVIELQKAGAAGVQLDQLPDEVCGPDGDPDKLSPAMLVYLAHEYLNQHWRPMFVTDLARDLGAAKLEFLGRSSLLDTLPALMLSETQAGIVERAPDRPMQELTTDLLSPTPFRRDVFARGAHRLSDARRSALLKAVELVLVMEPDEFPMSLAVRTGQLELEEAVYRPIIQRLAQGPAPVSELITLGRKGGAVGSPAEIIAVLEGSGAAAVAARTPADPAAVRRFNAALVQASRDQTMVRYSLAAAATGAGVEMPLPQFLAYLIAAGEPEGLAGLDLEPLKEIASGSRDFWSRLGML